MSGMDALGRCMDCGSQMNTGGCLNMDCPSKRTYVPPPPPWAKSMATIYKTEVPGELPTTFAFNTDLSSDVKIIHDGQHIAIPGANLRDFLKQNFGVDL